MKRAPRIAPSMTALPTRSSIRVNPGLRPAAPENGLHTAVAPLSPDQGRDHGPGRIVLRIGQERGRALSAPPLHRIDVDVDVEGPVDVADAGDPPVIVRAVAVEV